MSIFLLSVFLNGFLLTAQDTSQSTSNTSPQTEKEPGEATNARRPERERHYQEFQRLQSELKLAEAAEELEQCLAIAVEVEGENNESLVTVRLELAVVAEQAERWDTATAQRKILLQRAIAIQGADHWTVTDAKLAIKDIEIRRGLIKEQRAELRRANTLNASAIQAYQAGNYAAALEHANELLAIRKTILGEHHSDYATSLQNLAFLYDNIGEYAKSQALYQQALEIKKVVLGVQHPNYANSLNNLAFLYDRTGEYARAQALYQQALEIRKTALGTQHPDYANSLNNLAALYYSLGEYVRAEPLYQQALQIRRVTLGERHPNYANSLNNLATLYHKLGEYALAQPLYQQVLEIRKDSLGEQHPDYAASLNNLAAVYASMGDFTRAQTLYQRSVAVSKATLGEQHPDHAISLNNLAKIYSRMRDHALAELLYQQALEIRKAALGEQHPDFATSLNDLASLYVSMGEYARAEPLYQQALEIRKIALGEKHPDYATSLNNMAGLYYRIGDLALVEPLYTQVLKLRKTALGEQHPEYAVSLNNLAMLYAESQRFDEALPLYEQTLAITRKNLENAAYVLSERQQLAMVQGLRYQFDNYLGACLAAPSMPPKAVENVLLWKGSVLFRLRGLRIAANDPSIAEQFGKLQQATAQLSKLAQAVPEPRDSDNWKSRVATLTAEKEVLEADLMRSSAVFRDAVQQITFGQIQQAIPTDGVLVDYLEFDGKTGRELLASIVKHDGEPFLMISLGSATEVSTAIDVWRETFGMSPQAKAAGLALRKKIWEPVLAHLGAAKTILVSTDGVLGRLPLAALPGKVAGHYLIEDHRLALIPVPQLLPAMVNEHGQKNLQHELLLMGDVNYDSSADNDRSSATDSTAPRKRPWERGQLDAAVRGDAHWNALSETKAEVEFIAGLYNRLYQPGKEAVLDLRQSAASETAFRQFAPECVFLHLATHGFFAAADQQSALSSELVAQRGQDRAGSFGQEREAIRGYSPGQLSGIVFAGANQPPAAVDPLSNSDTPDDGIMTSDEIAFLRLEGVRLVVLSACETGLGEVAGGEGLLGIQRGFQLAGAHSTVASLWKVNDPATRRLMQEFYTNYLEKEMSMLDALRETQLWALHHPTDVPRGVVRDKSADEPTRLPPEYWAPFVLSGDWR